MTLRKRAITTGTYLECLLHRHFGEPKENGYLSGAAELGIG